MRASYSGLHTGIVEVDPDDREQDNRFYFTTHEITFDISQASYPNEPYVSFLDHIMVSEQLLPRGTDYDVKTILMGDYMDGYDIYEAYISDHLPVLLSFSIQSEIGQ